MGWSNDLRAMRSYCRLAGLSPFFCVLGGELFSVLTPTQKRYVDICTYKIAHAEIANKDIAEVFDIAPRTVDLAIAWGKRHELFRRAATDKINHHIQEIRAHLKWLESELRILKRSTRHEGKRIPLPAAQIRAISAELRETRVVLMELEGIYRKTLNLQHTGGVGEPIRYELVRPDETDQD